MQARIGRRAVDALAPTQRDSFLWDTDLRGFGVKCTPKGRKVYVVQYQLGGRGTPLRRMTIGAHGSPWTPERARAEAERILAEAALGGDPAGAKAKKRSELTVADVADRYLAEHVSIHNRPSTANEARRIVEKRIKPSLGRIKISELTRAHIKAWHHKMHATPYEANRALAYCSKMLNLAANDWELRPNNPCRGIKRYAEAKRERYLLDEELSRIGAALDVAQRKRSHLPGCLDTVRLLAVTGMRLGEVLSLRWEDVDFNAGSIRLREEKAKAGARTVPLSAPALEILSDIERTAKYVALGSNPSKPLSEGAFRHFWNWVRVEADLFDARPHDFRHTAGTYAAQAGFNAFMVRDLLGHKTLAMTGRYVERAAAPTRAAANAFAGRVAAAMSGKPQK